MLLLTNILNALAQSLISALVKPLNTHCFLENGLVSEYDPNCQFITSSTINVFKCLDQLKKDNIIKKTILSTPSEQKRVVSPPVSNVKNNEDKNHKTVSHQKNEIITSSTKSDDEWESF